MELTFLLITLAFLIEAVVESIVLILEGGLNWQKIVAFVLSGVAAYAFGLSISALLGLTLTGPAWLGIVLDILFAGAILMRGSGFVNDFFAKATKLRA